MRGPRTSRSSYKPLRTMPSRIAYREHVAAALGAIAGMLAVATLVIGIEVAW